VLDTLERGWRASVDPRARFIEGSVADASAVQAALDGCDAVMHLAGYIEVAESQAEPDRYFQNNSEGPRVMLDAMVASGVTSIVFSSTAAVYGEPTSVPISEDAEAAPVNAYGESKLRFERYLDEYATHGIRSVRLRYFNVAGAWPDGSLGEAHDPESHIIPRILMSIRDGRRSFDVYGDDYPTPDGTCVRDYIHVMDLAHAHRLALEHLHAGGGQAVLNLGNGMGFSNLEVVSACARVTGFDIAVNRAPRRAGDPAVLVASAQRAREVLGWAPQSGDLEQMIGDAWRWHLAHPSGYR
jgi:UDP-glucose 4-epimerase